ncbi:MAG: thrombospondin type 3 repeat-containing protein [Thermoleophilaceae bacterium]|nr:thrombospondin type 3 repeat-containing protein [Thermoleophilaceae bacterium]
MIATDGAGRVLVPERAGGRVLVFDNARRGNVLLRSFGQGILVDPYAVAVDDREDIYVADRGLNAIVVFDAYVNNSGKYEINGTKGVALRQFDEPRQLVVDYLPRTYVVEAGNLRVQPLELAGTELRELFAFGLADIAGLSAPEGIAVDLTGHMFVSSSDASGVVHYFDQRGASLGVVAASGTGTGQVNAPRGMMVDPVGRLLVADSGNNRVSLFNSVAGGLAPLASFGTLGAGNGEFSGVSSVSLAPGAMLYAADPGNGRIARLRFDDQDHDNALDAQDTCPGVADPKQNDHDGDGAGDLCDLDDDGDGLPDSVDACPISAPILDANGDGCGDPISVANTPASYARVSQRAPGKITGRASADRLGVRQVQVAVALRTKHGCRWLDPQSGRLKRGSCAHPSFNRATGTRKWRFNMHANNLPDGRYIVLTRAQQKRSGLWEPARNVKTRFQVIR